MHLRLPTILTAVQNLEFRVFIDGAYNWRCRPLGDEFLDTIGARSEEADVGSSEEAR